MQTNEGRLMDFTSIVAYYVTPSKTLSLHKITVEALKILSLTQEIVKTDLYSSLKQAYGLNLHN
jgi:hypothetical protein